MNRFFDFVLSVAAAGGPLAYAIVSGLRGAPAVLFNTLAVMRRSISITRRH
jgi:hypothetical protein